MNTEKIYKVANDLKSNKELLNSLVDKLNDRDLKTYNSLVRLGDSEELALATVLETSLTDEEFNEIEESYYFAYNK